MQYGIETGAPGRRTGGLANAGCTMHRVGIETGVLVADQ